MNNKLFLKKLKWYIPVYTKDKTTVINAKNIPELFNIIDFSLVQNHFNEQQIKVTNGQKYKPLVIFIKVDDFNYIVNKITGLQKSYLPIETIHIFNNFNLNIINLVSKGR